MTSWVEINRLKNDPSGARILAERLLRFNADALNDWETVFLGDALTWPDDEALSTRRIEKLVEIRDEVERVSTWRGFSVRNLVRSCYEGRADLGDQDEAWINELRTTDAERVRRRELPRLAHCARSLGVIEDW